MTISLIFQRFYADRPIKAENKGFWLVVSANPLRIRNIR